MIGSAARDAALWEFAEASELIMARARARLRLAFYEAAKNIIVAGAPTVLGGLPLSDRWRAEWTQIRVCESFCEFLGRW